MSRPLLDTPLKKDHPEFIGIIPPPLLLQFQSKLYSRISFTNNHPKIYCFDDLGTEQSLKYFGNECNVMAEIFLSRYEYFVSQKMITHVTTNLSSSEIEVLYGNRLRSRLREMMNLIDVKSGDKRL